MFINAGHPDYFNTSVAKYYVGKAQEPEVFNAMLKKIIQARNPMKKWPVIAGTSYADVVNVAGKLEIMEQINEYLRASRADQSVTESSDAPENSPFAMVAAKRGGHSGTEQIKFLRDVPEAYESIQFGYTLMTSPWNVGLKPTTAASTIDPYATMMKTRSERLEACAGWIKASWIWDYDHVNEGDFFQQKDPDTPGDLSGAARQRRGVTWIVQCLHAYAMEIVHAVEAPVVLSAINFLKEPFIWDRLNIVIKEEIDRYVNEYSPMAPRIMDWGHMLPRDMDGWNGSGRFYPCAPIWADEIDLFNDEKVNVPVDRPMRLAVAVFAYLQEYVIYRREIDQTGVLSNVHSHFGFHSVATPYHLNLWGNQIDTTFQTGPEMSSSRSIHDFAGTLVLPQTTLIPTPVWADMAIVAYIQWSDQLAETRQVIWFPVSRSTRDDQYSGDGDCRNFRSNAYYNGAEGGTMMPNNFARMALHFPERTQEFFAEDLVARYPVLAGLDTTQQTSPWYNIWKGISFESAEQTGSDRPVSPDDARNGKWSGNLFMTESFKHPDMAEIIAYRAPSSEGHIRPMIGITKIREGLRSGVVGVMRDPKTLFRVEPGIEAATYASESMVEGFINSIG